MRTHLCHRHPAMSSCCQLLPTLPGRPHQKGISSCARTHHTLTMHATDKLFISCLCEMNIWQQSKRFDIMIRHGTQETALTPASHAVFMAGTLHHALVFVSRALLAVAGPLHW